LDLGRIYRQQKTFQPGQLPGENLALQFDKMKLQEPQMKFNKESCQNFLKR